MRLDLARSSAFSRPGFAPCARSRDLRGSSGLAAPVGDPGGALSPSCGPVGGKAKSMEVVGFMPQLETPGKFTRHGTKG